jgi:hypothetical protein
MSFATTECDDDAGYDADVKGITDLQLKVKSMDDETQEPGPDDVLRPLSQ